MSVSPPPAYPGQPHPQAGQPLPQAGQPSSQMMGVPQPCQTVVLSPAGLDESQRRRRERYSKAFKIIGKLQISFGIAEVLLGIVAIIIQGWFAYFATPIWMALLFFITSGFLSVYSVRSKKVRVANMVMSIITALAAFVLFLICIGMASEEGVQTYHRVRHNLPDGGFDFTYEYTNICYPGVFVVYNCGHNIAGRKLVDSLIGLVALTEGVLAIVSASYCCYSMCCTPSSSGSQAMAYYPTPGPVVYPANQAFGQMYVQVPPTNQGVPMYAVQGACQSQYPLPVPGSQGAQPQGNPTFPMAQPTPAPPKYYVDGATDTKAPLPE